MDKELEALERLYCEGDLEQHKKDYELLKNALAELKAIKDAKPSEALEGLKHIKKYYIPQACSARTYDYLEIIEQSLLKAQEQEKALKIIFEKKVNILLLYVVDSVDTYNQMYVYYKRNIINVKWCLTQEEFDTLKRYFGK